MKRWATLDGIRGVAILFVLIDHVGRGGRGGPVGVTLFFVLSGFLITNLLLREESAFGRIDLKTFYLRRGFRLVPALLVYLVGSALLAASVGMPGDWIVKETWPVLLYVSNYAQALGVEMSMHWHTWSLAVEEHFYLLWPVVLGLIPSTRRLGVILGGIVLFGAWSVVAALSFFDYGYVATDTNGFALASGCAVAIAHNRGVRPSFPHWVPMLGVALLAVLTVDMSPAIRQPITVLVSSITIWAGVNVGQGILAARPLAFFGRISYSLYLWHIPLLMFAGSTGQARVAAGVVAVLIAWMSWVLVERPMLRIRDTWVGARTPQLALAAASDG